MAVCRGYFAYCSHDASFETMCCVTRGCLAPVMTTMLQYNSHMYAVKSDGKTELHS